MIRNDNMKMAITPVIWMLLAMFAAPLPADARSLPNKAAMVQLERGLAAFNRHDYAVAGLLLKTPAERGNSRAQAILCFLNAYGRGVPQNFRESAIWCRRSADQGHAHGQDMLGLLYNSGHGVPEDFVQAYKWLNLAAARASGLKREFSYRIRDAVATKMSPAQIAKAQALAIAWRPKPEWPSPTLMAGRCADDSKCLDP